MAVYKGNARVVQTSAGSTRSFVLRTDSANSVAAGDLAVYTLAAGSSIDLTYRSDTSGIAPPAAANTVILRVYYETGTGLLVRELYNGGPPSSPTTFTFHATDTGEAGGSPRAGTLRLYVQAIRTDLGAYNVDSDNDGDQAAVRSNAKVSFLAVSAFPAGSVFTYGAAQDEDFTLTATHTQAYEVRGHENIRIDALDGTAQQVAGTGKNIGSSTTTAQEFTANNTFDEASKLYGMEFIPTGTALLVPDSEPSMLWTSFVDDGANVEQSAERVRRESFYEVDPRYAINTLVLGQDIYNREQNAAHSFGITNARGEELTRLVTWNILDGNDDIVASVSDTGPSYTNTRAIGKTERATNDAIGDPRDIVTTLADAYNESASIYSVIRKWVIKKSAGADGGTVFTGKESSPTSDAKSLFNRKQFVFFGAELFSVSGDALGAVSGFFAPRRVDQEIYELSMAPLTLSAGGVLSGANAKYQIPEASVLSPAGRSLVYSSENTQQPRTGTGGAGNFAETDIVTPEWTITNFLNVVPRLQKLPTFNSNPETTVYTIGNEAIYMLATVTDAVGDPVDNAVVIKKQFDPLGIESASGQGTTDIDGRTLAASFQPNTPPGEWTYRASTDFEGNSGTGDKIARHVSAFVADKAINTAFGPLFGMANSVAGRQTSRPGDLPKPGDHILVGIAITKLGIRQELEPTPAFQLGHFDQPTERLQILQSDYTWKSIVDDGYEPHFFDYKRQIDSNLEWIASFGTAAQGVTAENGYVTDTADWEPGTVFKVLRLTFGGQQFYTPADHILAGPSAMHAMDADDIPGTLVVSLFDATGLFK
jgi:hypothetical protein